MEPGWKILFLLVFLYIICCNLFSTKKHLFGKIGVKDVIYIHIVLERFYMLYYL